MKQFKVGEQVAVYLDGQRCKGFVHQITESGNLKIKCDSDEPYGYPIVHPKQCRRLVKKERRRIWIAKYSLGHKELMHGDDDVLFCEPTEKNCDDPSEWAEFIEVKRKESK